MVHIRFTYECIYMCTKVNHEGDRYTIYGLDNVLLNGIGRINNTFRCTFFIFLITKSIVNSFNS